jgi:UDP-N-acetylmuramate dehydrogenase
MQTPLRKLLEEKRAEFSGTMEFDAPLSRFTYYRIGGPASVLATPKTIEDLKILQHCVKLSAAKSFVLGWGSNLLCADEGFDGLVIRMKQLGTEIEELGEGRLKVGASVGGSTLLRRAQEKGYGNLSHLTGIPGSIGGMVAMNAGTHLGEFKKNSISTTFLREHHLNLHHTDESSFSYRHNHFLKSNDIVVHTEISYEPTDPLKVKSEIDELYQRRKQTQPVDVPSCGSVFMNPKASGLNAWQVIDQLGLRAHQIGAAQFSEKHSNFIINLGNAKATDVKQLITLAKTRAKNELGILLQEEVKFVE